MKTKTILFTAIALFLLIGAVGCKKENPNTPSSDPKKAILGKWELIEHGAGNVTEPCELKSIFVEYLEDGRMTYYKYNHDRKEYIISDGIYWIDEKFLYWGSRDKTIIYKNFYKFYEDKMWVQLISIYAVFNTFVYQRKK